MMRRSLSFTVVAMVLAGAAGLAARQHPAQDSTLPPTNTSPEPFISRGEPVVAVMGCLMEGHGDHHGLVLGQVQRSSISVAGITSDDPSAWVVERDSEGDVSQGADANPTHLPGDSSVGLTRTEYEVAPGALNLQPYLDQQVRMTGVFRTADGHTTLHVLRISPVGALCAGGH